MKYEHIVIMLLLLVILYFMSMRTSGFMKDRRRLSSELQGAKGYAI